MIVSAIILAIVLLIVVLLYLFPIPKVEGDSMYPTLKQGDILIASRIFNRKNFEIGAIYIIKSPDIKKRKLIKRLDQTYGSFHNLKTNTDHYLLWFSGDNSRNSYDSRHFGYLSYKDVVAKIIYPKK